jgi:hypothetical protein
MVVAAVSAPALTSVGWIAALVSRPVVEPAWSTWTRPGRDPQPLVESLVVLLSAVTLTATLGWLVVSTVVCLLDVRHGIDLSERSGTFRPRFIRALLALTISSLVATAGPVGAEPGVDRGPGLAHALDGLTVPDRVYGGVRTHQVRDGESLWRISADALAPDARTSAIGRTWHRLYRLNRARVGRDPGLIHPGQTLRLPPAVPRSTNPSDQPVRPARPTRGVTR